MFQQHNLIYRVGIEQSSSQGGRGSRDRGAVAGPGLFLLYFKNLLFWLHWVFIVVCGLLIVVASLVL